MSEERNELNELNTTQTDHEYGGSEIQVLEGLEAVRKRPGMYIGSTSESGLHHLVYEIVDNSIDEALAGHCTDITVTINPGNTITVTDNGRGIPVDIQPQTGKPALEVVFTILHAGGKFGGGGYKVSGGLHGVGASVVNALSEWLEVQVHKNGEIYEMKFSRGKITQEMKVVGKTDHTGTTVTFKPDPEMFDTLEYSYDTLHTRMREEAFLNAGLRIQTVDLRPGQEQEDDMCYEGGIREFVTFINRNKDPLHNDVIYMSGAREDSMAEVAMQYNDGYQEVMVSFANNVHTAEGGMHEEGFRRALTNVLNAYGRKIKMLKDDEKVSGDDCREGLTVVISVKLTEAQFEGQTKAKLGNSEMRTLVNNIVSEKLEIFLEENPSVGRAILDKALMANRAREAARKARESVRRKTALGGAAMPDKHLFRNLVTAFLLKPVHKLCVLFVVASGNLIDQTLQIAGYQDIHGRRCSQHKFPALLIIRTCLEEIEKNLILIGSTNQFLNRDSHLLRIICGQNIPEITGWNHHMNPFPRLNLFLLKQLRVGIYIINHLRN